MNVEGENDRTKNRLEMLCKPTGLQDDLWQKLRRIPCTEALFPSLPYRPAAVKTIKEIVEPCVVFFGRKTYQKFWGNDPGRRMLNIEDVVDVMPSEYQLPVKYASALYDGGETRMGGIDFTLIMKDDNRFYYTLGGVADFITYPSGYTCDDIECVEKGVVKSIHIENPERVLGGPDYIWCLFPEANNCLEKISKEQPCI